MSRGDTALETAPSLSTARSGPDAVTALTVYIVLLYAMPSGLTITALGSIGRPALLWGLGLALGWVWSAVHRFTSSLRAGTAIRVSLFVVVLVVLLSYATAQARGMPADELSPADSSLLRMLSWSGVALMAMNGITDRDRFHLLLRRLALAGGLLALLGLVQFATGRSWVTDVQIPGLSVDPEAASLSGRAGFARSSGTASHPLEYAVVLSAALPVGLSLALYRSRRSALGRSWEPLAITVASILSVSRSAILGVVTGVALLAPGWSPRVRRFALAAALALMSAIYVLVPGMVGTIANLFVGAPNDPSTKSRSASWGIAAEMVRRFPAFGRGMGTFLPKYWIFDNQYLLVLAELGVVGLLALLALVVVCMRELVVVGRAAAPGLDKEMARALLASFATCVVLFAFFDALSFPMAAGTLFLLVGLTGAARSCLTATAPS